jgi:pimeloyl-ACP methyl ester carboxylesterase
MDTDNRPMTNLILLHGFLSSPQGAKARFLRDKLSGYPAVQFHAIDFNPTPRDFEFMTVTGQINRLRQFVLDLGLESASLIGSSLGGQVALHYAHRFGGVQKLLLLAPALYYAALASADELTAWEQAGSRPVWHDAFQRDVPLRFDVHRDRLSYAEPPPPAAQTLIIHGVNDDVVPISGSRNYAAQYPATVQLIEANSDHRLGDQLDFIWQQVQHFLLPPR